MRTIFGRFGRKAPPDERLGNASLADGTKRDIPTAWLLGRTGAGKSSLIRALTGMDDIDVGNGYSSCTRTSRKLDFPAEEPLVRFLDTRGLGEAGYNPAEDLAACEGNSHAIIVVARLDDPVQGEIADALKAVMKRRPKMEVLLVHTGADLVTGPDARARARAATAKRFAEAAGRALPEIMLSLPPDRDIPDADFETLLAALAEILPNAAIALREESVTDAESRAFQSIRRTVLVYSGIAAASDAMPLVGLFSSTGVQFRMFQALGQHYDVSATMVLARHFISLLGVGIGGRLAGSIALRQGGKLIPVYGQTVGAAAASVFTFGATYALGRTAARYLHTLSIGEKPSRKDIQDTFRQALTQARFNGH